MISYITHIQLVVIFFMGKPWCGDPSHARTPSRFSQGNSALSYAKDLNHGEAHEIRRKLVDEWMIY